MANGNAPLTGVLGAQDVIRRGTLGALENLGQGLGTARGDILAGTEGLERQAALAGLRGSEAQGQAFQGFRESPGQQFLQEQGERAVTRQAAATGGLGGGNVLRELQRQAIGLAQQDFSNQFQRGQQVLGTQGQAAGQLAGLAAQGGIQGANLISGAAGQLGGQRFQAGQQLSQQAQQQANNLANLQAQLGQNIAGVTGQTGANLANIAQGAGQSNAQLQQQLATLLANIGTGTGSQAGQLQAAAGQFNAAGAAGQGAAVQNLIAQLAQFAGQGGFKSRPPSAA